MSSKKRSKYQLILKDDDINTFEHVIYCLIEYCNHNYYQAGQCATIVHSTGTCCIQIGWKDHVEELYDILTAEGLELELVKHTGR